MNREQFNLIAKEGIELLPSPSGTTLVVAPGGRGDLKIGYWFHFRIAPVSALVAIEAYLAR